MLTVQGLFVNSNMRKFIYFLLSMCCMTAHAQYANVNVGDIVDFNGVKGIVYQVDETGEHGKAMTISCLRGVGDSWCSDSKLAKKMPQTSDEQDGEKNTQSVIEYAKSNNALSKFPVFKWCAELGEGWYVPSLKELEAFVNYWLGNEQTIDWDSEEDAQIDDSKPYYKLVNTKIIEAGGVPFLNGVFTSTVNQDGKVYVFWFDRQKNAFSFKKWSKDNLSKYFVGRAFRKF